MRKHWLFISMVVLSGCDDQLPTAQEFPIVRTLAPTDNDETGATFQAEVLQTGVLGISSHGFIWAIADSTGQPADSVVVGAAIDRGEFKKRIDYSLAKAATYNVRAFVQVQNSTVYGNTVVFKSAGSTKSEWSLVLEAPLKGYHNSYGSSTQGFGHVLFGSSDAYYYDPEKKLFTSAPQFPVEGNSDTRFTIISAGKKQYFLSSINRNLYSFEGGEWSIESEVPFNYGLSGSYFHGYQKSDKLYVFSTYKSFAYDLNTLVWEEKTEIPGDNGQSIAGVSSDTHAYVMTSNRNIWEYNESTDQWLVKTVYPGSVSGKLVSFYFGGKIYFGLISRNPSQDTNWEENEFWSYDLETEEWEPRSSFPGSQKAGYRFYFSIDEMLFVGLSRPRQVSVPFYDLWQFDAGKLEK